jgi:hypothetical protein
MFQYCKLTWYGATLCYETLDGYQMQGSALKWLGPELSVLMGRILSASDSCKVVAIRKLHCELFRGHCFSFFFSFFPLKFSNYWDAIKSRLIIGIYFLTF